LNEALLQNHFVLVSINFSSVRLYVEIGKRKKELMNDVLKHTHFTYKCV